MPKYFVLLLFLALASPAAISTELFEIKSFCRANKEEAKKRLPVDINKFTITENYNPKYGREETWTLNDSKILKALGLKILKIEVQQNIIQSVWFEISHLGKPKKELFHANIKLAGLKEDELEVVFSEHRVEGMGGFPIRILGDIGGYYECFEYHAGH